MFFFLTAIIIEGKSFVEKGNKISLICNATGDTFPPEDIDWFKDGVKIKQNQNKGVSIVKFRLTETKTLHSKLVIDRSGMLDSGNYICRSSDLAITSKQVMVLNGKYNILFLNQSYNIYWYLFNDFHIEVILRWFTGCVISNPHFSNRCFVD